MGDAAAASLTNALAAVIHACQAVVGDWTASLDAVNTWVVVAVHEATVAASAASIEGRRRGAAVLHLFALFGWSGSAFVRPLDARYLASRLRALLYDGLTQAGAGAYSTVFRARCCLSPAGGAAVVLKVMRLQCYEEGVPATAVREVSLLRKLSECPNIIQLLDVLWDTNRLVLVFESMDRDLKAHLDAAPGGRQLAELKPVMYQVLKALAHAHAHRVLHRDLKPQNILVDPASGAVKLADFGLARTLAATPRPYTHEVVTLLYRAPELLLGSPTYSSPLDVWSAGCVLAELATGQPLFLGDSEIGQLMAIFQLLGTPSEEAWPGLGRLPDWQACFPCCRPRSLAETVPQLDPVGLDLLSSMLQYDPSGRITCRAALAHPWFDDVRTAEEARGRRIGAAVRQARQERQACVEAAVASAQKLLLSTDCGSASQASDQTAVLYPRAPNAPSTPQAF